MRTTDMQLIAAAANGQRGQGQQRIADTALDWLVTLLQKNADYGSSAWKKPLLAPHMDIGDAILVRMTDKIERIASLLQRPAEVKTETIEDTVRDLGAYCLLWLARPKDEDDNQKGPRT